MAARKGQAKTKGTKRTLRPRMPASSAAKPTKPRPQATTSAAGSRLVDQRLKSLGGWRAATLAEVRRLIRAAVPDMSEDCKWRKASNPEGVPVWSHAGIVCTGEAHQQVVKLTFARGASLPDPRGLFNASLEGNTRRAIDLHEGEALHAQAFQALVQAAVAENLRSAAPKVQAKTKPGKPHPAAARKPRSTALRKEKSPGVVLLSGGNPQIAKAEGNAPVQAYLAAIPGWKREIGVKLDALIVRHVPRVCKAVKWNSPFYGLEGRGWFVSFHVFTRYVKVTFFRGASLHPAPPGGTGKDARWIDVHEDDLEEAQMTAWIKQAAALPGWDASRTA